MQAVIAVGRIDGNDVAAIYVLIACAVGFILGRLVGR